MAGPFVANGTTISSSDTAGGGQSDFSAISDVINFSGPQSQAAEINITNLDDVTGEQYLPGIPDRGTFDFTIHWDPANTEMDRLLDDQVASPPAIRTYQVIWANLGTALPAGSATTTFDGFVQNVTRNGGTNAAATADISIRVTGAVTEGVTV